MVSSRITQAAAQRNHQRRPLAYGMRKAVQYCENNGSPLLILNYPLKAIHLRSFWNPVFDRLSRSDFIPFEDIKSLVQPADPQKIENFLNVLVRKGFLEQYGFQDLIDYPLVSIIIPVRNRPEEITACLHSLSRLDYPVAGTEVIVVDDASDDDTPEAISAFPVKLIPLDEHRQAPYCRNLAARQAKGEILAFIDSDCLADPLWLKALIPVFRDKALGAVGGVVDSLFEEKDLDRYEKVKSSLYMGSWFTSSREGNRLFYVPSCNLLVRRDLLLELGGFREELHVGEDVDFCWRLQDEGYHVAYQPIGRVYHRHRSTLMPFCSRRFDYGTSEPLLQRLHPKRVKEMLFPPTVSLFWGFAVLSWMSGSIAVLTLCGTVVLIDSLSRWGKIRRRMTPVGFPPIFLAVLRSYFAFFYHFCTFVSRYYLIWCILILPLSSWASATILVMHLVAGIAEYFIKKLRLNVGSYLCYFTLEQLSYQLGVWWGCLKTFSFNPVNPKLVAKAASKEK